MNKMVLPRARWRPSRDQPAVIAKFRRIDKIVAMIQEMDQRLRQIEIVPDG
jgi:hypothetical protein